MNQKFDIITRYKVVLVVGKQHMFMIFSLLFLLNELDPHMSLVDYRTIIRHRLMILLFSIDKVCPICRKTCLKTFEEHTIYCKELLCFKCRHHCQRCIFLRAKVYAKEQAFVNFLTNTKDGRWALGLTNVLVYGWMGRTLACVDLIEIFSLVGQRS